MSPCFVHRGDALLHTSEAADETQMKKRKNPQPTLRPQMLKIQMKAADSQLSSTGEQDLALYRTH